MANEPPTQTTNSQGRVGASTLISIATYNEIENLPRLIDAIQQVAPQVDILVIDDNSPDGTGRWVQERSATDPRVHAIHREGKLGLGSATICGYRYALQHGYKIAATMDADFSHDPKYLGEVLALVGTADDQADVVIGSRYIKGGGVEGWPLSRRLMSWGVNWYSRLSLGLSPRDCSGAYRAVACDTLAKVNWEGIWAKGYAFQEEVLWHLKRTGARFRETPIIFVDREKGQSKINLREVVTAIYIIGRLGIKNWIGI